MRILIDGKLVLGSDAGAPDAHKRSTAVTSLKGGKKSKLTIEYIRYPHQEVIFYRLGMGIHFPPEADPRFDRAVELAKGAEKVIFFGGMPDGFETEGDDRPDMRLPGRQDELIQAIAAVNPNTVVVLNTGSPVEMPWSENVAAIVQAFFPGLENGNAVTRVLFGDVNPSGKLPVTFPKRLQDSPAYINASYPGCREVNYGEGIFVGYRYFDKVELEPLFPFGHGLSYTKFKYGKLTSPARGKRGETLTLTVDVTNIGDRPGAEVIQLYVSDKESSLPRPRKELKGFEKVALKPGETRTVEFRLNERSFAFYDPHARKWVAEPGEYEISAGSSSRDLRIHKKFELL